MRPDDVSDAERDAAAVEVVEALRAIWERHRPSVLERTRVLQQAADALAGGDLAPALREEARSAAHRLAGSLGTFGLGEASERARRAELLLAGERHLGAADGSALAALAQAVEQQVLGAACDASQGAEATAAATAVQPSPAGALPTVLIVEDDLPLAECLALEAGRLDLRAEIATTPAAARSAVAGARPDAVLLDLTFADDTACALDLLSELTSAVPPIPVLVSTIRDGLADRVEVARRGGRSFVTKALPADAVIRQVVQLIEQSRAAEIAVLAVDDDAALLDVVRATLTTDGYRVVTLADPRRFWHELERVQPDIVLLDIEMPHISGLELCRVLRNDTRWATAPVLMLTARRDAETIEQIFAAGADDHIAKPLLAAELRVRLHNRVERLRMHRALAETDGLTGIANRHTAAHALERLIRLATRQQQQLALALLDLDGFKQVNDRHGHAAGDDVLRRFGRFLRHAFRGEDVVGRWGGEEFVVGMYGMDGEHAVARLTQLLEAFGGERFAATEDEPFRVGFSAGIAVHPRDGADLEPLLEVADDALYRAKEDGRGRVALAASTPMTEERRR